MTPPATISAKDTAAGTAPAAPPSASPARQQRTVQITYSPTEWALLEAAFPMSEDDWDAMIAVLSAMKRGLVAEPKPHNEP